MLLLLVVYRIKPKKNGKLNTIKFLLHLFSHQETTNRLISFFFPCTTLRKPKLSFRENILYASKLVSTASRQTDTITM